MFKRIFDFISAIIAFLILSPIFFIVLVCLLFVNKGKPFFFQERPGKHQSFVLDFKIIFLTIKRLIMPEGINNIEGINMPEFTGSKNG